MDESFLVYADVVLFDLENMLRKLSTCTYQKRTYFIIHFISNHDMCTDPYPNN